MAEEKNKQKRRATNKTSSKRTNPKKRVEKKKPTQKVETKKEDSVKNQKQKAEKKTEVTKKILESTTLPPNLEKTIIFNKEQTKNINEVMDTLEKETTRKQRKEIKVKNRILLILTMMLLITIILCTIYVASTMKKEKDLEAISAKAKESEPDTINSDVYKKVVENTKDVDFSSIKGVEEPSGYDTIISLSLEEFESKIISKEDMVVFISKKTCYYCLTFEETIHNVLKEKDKKIYKLDIVNMSKDEIDRLRKYYHFTITPTVFKIENGIVTSDLIEAQNEENFTHWVEENMEKQL